MTKICFKCGVEKDIEEFSKGHNQCKKCLARHHHEYYKKHQEILTKRRKYRRWITEVNKPRDKSINRQAQKSKYNIRVTISGKRIPLITAPPELKPHIEALIESRLTLKKIRSAKKLEEQAYDQSIRATKAFGPGN